MIAACGSLLPSLNGCSIQIDIIVTYIKSISLSKDFFVVDRLTPR
jgi:hypothetical protein